MQTLSDPFAILREQLARLSSLLSPEPGQDSFCCGIPVMEAPLNPTRTMCACGLTYERRPR